MTTRIAERAPTKAELDRIPQRVRAMRYGHREPKEPKRETITRWCAGAAPEPQRTDPVPAAETTADARKRAAEQAEADRIEKRAIEDRKSLGRRLVHARHNPHEVSWDEFLEDVKAWERTR